MFIDKECVCVCVLGTLFISMHIRIIYVCMHTYPSVYILSTQTIHANMNNSGTKRWLVQLYKGLIWNFCLTQIWNQILKAFKVTLSKKKKQKQKHTHFYFQKSILKKTTAK